MQKLLKKKFCKTILLTLPFLIVLQDVSYALSPTSQFKPITDSEERLTRPPAVPTQAETASDVLKPQKENEPVPISPIENLKAVLKRYNNPDAKAPTDFSEGQNFIHQILFEAEELPEAEEIKEEAAHVLAKWLLELLEALAVQIKKMRKSEDFEGIIKAIDEKFLSQPIIKQTWNEEHRLPLFKEFEPKTGNHFLAHIRGGPLSRIYMYAQLIRKAQTANKKYSEYKEKIREAIKDADISLGQFRDKLAESLYKKEDSRRLKPFFKKHELGFQNIAAVIMAASELKKLIIDKKAREGAVYAKIGKLNKRFPSGEIEIEKKLEAGVFKCSGKEYKYTVFHFKKEKKTINVLFLEDHAALSPAELAELKIQDIEKYHLDCPGLEGVWFINPAAISKQADSEPPAMPTLPPAVETMPQPRIGGAREPVLEREAIQNKINLLEDAKRKLENNEFSAIINFGDKHGVAADLERILQAAQKADRDGKRLVIIGHGDAFDRGNQSFRNFEILQELKNIAERNPNISVYLCFGNHDVLVIQALLLNNAEARHMWLNQGGMQVLDEFNARGADIRRMATWMLKNLKIFNIDEMGFLHLHAGIPMDKNGNPLISMKQLKTWQDDLDSIKQALNQDPAFLESESNRLRVAKLFDEAEDIFWVRQDRWIANLMDGREAARIRIDERNKAELFSLLEESIKANMPSISKAQIEEQIKENWGRILIQFEKQFKMAGIEFELFEQEPKINKDKLDRLLAQLGVNGVVFGHIHAGELINIDNRIFCVDVYDVNAGDEGHLIFNGEGIKFNVMRRGEYLIAALATMIADIDAQIIRLKKRLGEGAAQEEAIEVLRKIVEGMEPWIMSAIAQKGQHLNLGDVVISVHTGTRREILSINSAAGIAHVERTDTNGNVYKHEIDIADIVKAVQNGTARIEPASSARPVNVNNEKTAIKARTAVIKEIAETRQAAIVETLSTLEEKDNDVKVVVGVPIGMNIANVQPAISAINRGLAKNGFGRMEDNKQVITFEIDKVKTTQNQERAVQKAREGLAPNGRIVVFAPQMERGPQLAGKAQEAYKDQSNITVVPDAYTDSAPDKNIFPDIMVRVALGRNIAFYYTGKDPQATLASINDLLAKVADGSAPIVTVDDLLNILKPLRIRPIYYNAITYWQRAQEAVATSL